jgi:hypothetical protein
MINPFWPERDEHQSPLPLPNVVLARTGMPINELSPEALRGILVNPIYAGLGPFPRLVDDEAWVRAAAGLIDEDGAEQFLVNLLFVLRECFPKQHGQE